MVQIEKETGLFQACSDWHFFFSSNLSEFLGALLETNGYNFNDGQKKTASTLKNDHVRRSRKPSFKCKISTSTFVGLAFNGILG